MDPSLEYIDLVSVDMQADNKEITRMIMEQCTQLGFLAITNIPNYDEEELFK